MKQTLLLLSILFSFTLSAQVSLTLSVPDSSVNVIGNEDQVIAKGTLKNESTDSVTLNWSREIVELSDGWETAVCDKNLCYIPSIAEMELVLAGGEESIFNIYIYPNNTSGGSAIVDMTITDANDANNAVSGRYEFNQNTTSTRTIVRSDVKIYPNPTADYISLTETEFVNKLIIYNIVGRPVKVFDANYSNLYNVIDLPTGMYLIRLMDRNEKTIKTVRLSKKAGA